MRGQEHVWTYKFVGVKISKNHFGSNSKRKKSNQSFWNPVDSVSDKSVSIKIKYEGHKSNVNSKIAKDYGIHSIDSL